MGRWGIVMVAALCACGSQGQRDTVAWDPSSSDGSGPGDGSSAGSHGTTATSIGTASGTDGSSSDGPGDGSSAATLDGGSSSGGGYDCESLGYTGLCDGELLVWCEDGAIQMADCAAMGQSCAWAGDAIGYDCVPIAGRGGFGYPVGDGTTWPAGGWTVSQVLGHYLDYNGFVGGHLAEDIAAGEAETANAPVYAVADGTVLYAGANASTYVNVVLIQHEVDGTTLCSFYGHLGSVAVAEGDVVARGDTIAHVLDWQAQFGYANSHLHYVLLSQALCDASDGANGALVCGYDDTPGPNGIVDLDSEPATYTSVGDVCGDQNYPEAFIAPSQFIEAHHF